MVKRRKTRGAPVRRKIRAAPALESRWRDPFEVIGKIPNHLSYQWVAISVLGEQSVAKGTYGNWMEAGSWKPVPAKRHPKMSSDGKRIVVQGQLLMQRPAALTEVALQKNNDVAKGAVVEHGKMYGHGGEAWNSPRLPAISVTDEDVEYEAQKLPVVRGQRYCRVNIPVTVSDDEIKMALYLKLDPAEYVRRRVIMDTDAMVKRMFSTPEKEHLFSRAEFQARILTESNQ